MDALSSLRKARGQALRRVGRLFLSSLPRQSHLCEPGAERSVSRPHFQACKLRLRLGGNASPTAPLPERPRRMHQRTYERLSHRLLKMESELSPRVRSKPPDYPSLVAYFP